MRNFVGTESGAFRLFSVFAPERTKTWRRGIVKEMDGQLTLMAYSRCGLTSELYRGRKFSFVRQINTMQKFIRLAISGLSLHRVVSKILYSSLNC